MAGVLKAVPETARRGRDVPWRSICKVAVLEHRAGLASVALLSAACLAALLIKGLGSTMSLAQFLRDGAENTSALSVLDFVALAFPAVIGIFMGAPLVSRELETGTFRFTWTQAVGRTRFARISALFLGVVSAVLACAVGVLLTWYAGKFEVLGIESRWQAGFFLASPIVLPALTLASLAFGVLAGTVVKRTVAAMAVTTVVTAGLLTALMTYLVRTLLSVSPLVTNRISPVGNIVGSLNSPVPSGRWPGGAWLVRSWLTGPDGRQLTSTDAVRVMHQITSQAKGAPSQVGLAHPQAFTFWVSYQPADRFWVFQLLLAAALLGLAIAALAATMRRIRTIG